MRKSADQSAAISRGTMLVMSGCGWAEFEQSASSCWEGDRRTREHERSSGGTVTGGGGGAGGCITPGHVRVM